MPKSVFDYILMRTPCLKQIEKLLNKKGADINQRNEYSGFKVKRIAVNVGSQVTDRMPLIFLEE